MGHEVKLAVCLKIKVFRDVMQVPVLMKPAVFIFRAGGSFEHWYISMN